MSKLKRNQVISSEKTNNNKKEGSYPDQLFLPEDRDRYAEGGLWLNSSYKKSHKNQPLISVVTIVFNGEAYIEETILSVLNQAYDNIEYIIIDGGSTDLSCEIIKKYEDKIDYWLSEKDNGIYDAFNKGISLCTGKYVGLINADDYYNLNAIKTVVQAHLQFPEIDIFYGDMYLHNEKHHRKKRMNALSLDNLDSDICVNHPTCFVRRKIYNDFQFDLNYRLSADYDLIIRFFKNNFKFHYIDKIIANMRDGGVSTAFDKAEKETYAIRKKYFGKGIANKVYLKKLVRKWIKSVGTLVFSERKWIEKRYSD